MRIVRHTRMVLACSLYVFVFATIRAFLVTRRRDSFHALLIWIVLSTSCIPLICRELFISRRSSKGCFSKVLHLKNSYILFFNSMKLVLRHRNKKLTETLWIRLIRIQSGNESQQIKYPFSLSFIKEHIRNKECYLLTNKINVSRMAEGHS